MMRARRQQGQALLVMMAVLVLASLHAVFSRLGPTRPGFDRVGDDAIARAKEALLWYAVTYRDTHEPEVAGYLPCPDTGDDGGAFAAGNGIAAASCGTPGAIAVGLLPYRTLGLPDLRDAAGDCLWYAVSGSFKNAPKAGIPLDWDTQGQLGVVDAGGGVLATPDDADGGAAAIVFSPGPALPGQSRRPTSRPCNADPAQITAFLESAPPAFATGDATNARGETTRNDRLAWVTPREIFDRVIARADFGNPLGSIPEGRINQLIEGQRKALDGRIWAGMSTLTAGSTGTPGTSATPANAADYAQFPGKQVGDVPDLAPLEYHRRNLDRDFENWREQFRYVVCDDLRPMEGCLAAGARHCRGALLFAGRGAGGGPRPASTRPHPPPPSRSTWLAHYFESGALELLDGPAFSFTTAGRYEGGNPGADVGVCLSPGAYTSFAKDIAGYVRTASSALRPEAAIDVATRTLTLGNPAATAAGSGCAWFPVQLPFATSLRAYFKLRIADSGEGLTLAIIDGDHNTDAMRNGGPCGNPAGAQLGYSGPRVAPPKFGLEIDTRAQATGGCSGNNRYDPSSNHMAFVYWGTASADSDDNCHGAGTAGDGAQPLNPRTLGSGIATVHASDPHLPYAGSLPTDTDIHVRLDVTKAYDGVQVAAAHWSAADARAVLVTEAPHRLVSGQRVTVSGVNPPGYDGTVTITVHDDIRLAYDVAADPGAYAAGGHVAPPPTVAVVGAEWSNGIATLVTGAPHGFVDGQPVALAGTTPVAYGGSYAVEVVDARRLRIVVAADPGPYVSGGSLAPAALLNLKAYVASRFLVFSSGYVSTCTVAEFRDLSQELDALCTQDASLVAQDVPVNADPTTGRALPQVYIGFTTAQATGAAGRQRLTISDFLANVQ